MVEIKVSETKQKRPKSTLRSGDRKINVEISRSEEFHFGGSYANSSSILKATDESSMF